VIEFSGDARLVRNAFGTEIRRLQVDGVERWANMSEPQIPAAIAPVLSGVVGLNNFRPRPLYHKVGAFRRTASGDVRKRHFLCSRTSRFRKNL
jgi:hypothetical protein